MIDVDNVSKDFGPVKAISDVTFQVGRNEIVGLLGLNGAGKTTLMRILTTYMPATSGRARVAGYDVMSQSMDVRRNIGYLPENVPLYSEMRVEEYLNYRATLKGVERQQRRARIDASVERCRIREVRRRLLGTLSKGYRQRVGLADAMIHDPPIFILDEPTDGLDPVQKRETLATLKDLGQTHTIMLSTHLLAEVEAICERVVILKRGRVSTDKRLAELETDAVIVLEVRGPAEQVTNLLRATDGITQVTPQSVADGLTAYEVRTHNGQDLREVISQRVAKNGWTIRRLDLRRRRLDDRFMDVIREEESPKGRIAPASSTSVQASSPGAAAGKSGA
jgi:ABC-2 type transport system ATP-binding protein